MTSCVSVSPLNLTNRVWVTRAAIDRAIEYFLKDSLSVHHPQCVAHLHCPSTVISRAAEVLINATNQSMDSIRARRQPLSR